MKEIVKNGHNFNVDLSLPRKFWLHQSYGLRRPLATSFSISDLNMAFAMFTKLLLGSRLENLFILTHISSEDIVFNYFCCCCCYCFYLVCTLPQEWMVTISDYCYQAPTLWQPLPQVTCPSPALLQSDQLRPHRCVCTVIKNSSCSSEVLPNERVKPRCQFFFSSPQQMNFYLKSAPKHHHKVKPHNSKRNLSSPKASSKLGPRWDTDNI